MISDGRHAGRDSDLRQITAVREGLLADARHAALNDNTCYVIFIAIPWPRVIFIIRHVARAADGEGVSRLHVGVSDGSSAGSILIRPCAGDGQA